ncbi:hypothetical protein E2C01_069038 [Portunus trituberculatus]|uniref:Uncharacterized protein n=1 Tax=Portunus trituberculatus TaxID=210409 RepID=A0A5B7HY55_PORTR|nr:hypothetical protein [Portunus trituberculatus]
MLRRSSMHLLRFVSVMTPPCTHP